MRFRFPWVPRFVYDDVLEQLKYVRAQNAQLTDTLVQMKVAGGVMVRPPDARLRELAKPVPKSAIEQAIDENKHASRNPRLRAHLAEWAATKIECGVPEKAVVAQLRTWDAVSAEGDGDADGDADDVIVLGGEG